PEADVARVLQALVVGDRVTARGTWLELAPHGILDLLTLHADIERALDPSPPLPGQEDCPSIPWLTAVQTCWIDALSINYRPRPCPPRWSRSCTRATGGCRS